ncbi:MAG: hypothetical protein QW334_00145 [Thermofilum sp.]
MSRLKVLNNTTYAYGYVKRARKPYTCWICKENIAKDELYIERRPIWLSGERKQVCLRHMDGLMVYDETLRRAVTEEVLREWGRAG